MQAPLKGRVLQFGLSIGGTGGVDRYLPGLLRALDEASVRCVGLATQGSLADEVSCKSITTFASSDSHVMWRLWRARRCGVQFLNDEDISLVAAHFALYALPNLRCLRGRPLVIHFHGPWYMESAAEGQNPFIVQIKRQMENAVYRRASQFITLSRAFASVLHKSFAIPLERIHVIPGAVDIEHFAPRVSRIEARERLGWPLNRPIVVTVRRLVKRMGLEEFIEAVSIVKKAHPDLRVYMAGIGRLEAELRIKIDSMGLHDTIKLVGYVPDSELPLLYRAADLSAVPSLQYEGFGLSAVESLASGTPVLATRIGGLPEIFGNLSPEMLVHPVSVRELAKRLSECLNSLPSLPGEAACREHAVRNFSWRSIAARTIDVYRAALR